MFVGLQLQHLGGLPDELQAGRQDAVEEAGDQRFVLIVEQSRQSVEPRQQVRSPAEHVGLQVDHPAARHLSVTQQVKTLWLHLFTGESLRIKNSAVRRINESIPDFKKNTNV